MDVRQSGDAAIPETSTTDVRTLDAGDLELVCRHREAMFRDAGRDDEELATMTEHFRPWLLPRLRDGSYFGFVLEDQGRPIAGIGLMLIAWPPHPLHPTQDRRGYVLNVYVEPDYAGAASRANSCNSPTRNSFDAA